jgi:hypothetical protein
MKLLGDVHHVDLVFAHLETVFMSVQDRCMICAKHTMAHESFWMHPMVLLVDEAQVDTHLTVCPKRS